MTQELLDEVKGIFTEGEFISRWTLIEMNHHVGKLITEQKEDITNLVHDIAVGIGRSERGLWTAVKFYKQYPSLDLLPVGKNASMNQIINKLLTTPKEQAEHVCTPITICSQCHKRIDIKEAIV
jgi:hypothetical protein